MKKWLKIAVLLILVIGVGVLLMAAHNREGKSRLNEPAISIDVQNEIALLTEIELRKELEINQLFHDGMTKDALDVKKIEQFLMQMNEIQTADVYVDIGNNWHIDVQTRRPIARVILNSAPDFYLDSRGEVMHISAYSKPKILCFTGLDSFFEEIQNGDELINKDTLKTKFKRDQVYRISSYVCSSAFYDAQIVQVHFSADNGFMLVPRVGSQEIIFGSAQSDDVVAQKFEKLTTFYEEVIPFEGWDKYREINLKFEDQIVAKKK